MMGEEILVRLMIFLGIVLILSGFILNLFSQIPYLGRLPGDIRIEREGISFYFPLTSSLVISIFLTIIFQIFS